MPKRILIAPLDWGLGHATRCIPIIRYLMQRGHEPVLCAEGRIADLLRAEFPELPMQHLEGYRITYPRGVGMVWKMAVTIPHILRCIAREERELRRLAKEWKADAVISDNRFGFHHPEVPSAYITHQVMIKAPMAEPVLYAMHRRHMERFHRTWVPDVADAPGLSGDLGHRFALPRNGRYLGPLTRFSGNMPKGGGGLVAVISGPEPQRTLFEENVRAQLRTWQGPATVVCGRPDLHTDELTAQGHRIVSHLPSAELEAVMSGADVVLSRSGYSTVMDLAVTGRKAIFVPTLGQTEQEYLAQLYHQRGLHLHVPQRQFDLHAAMAQVGRFRGFGAVRADLFHAAVDELVG
jgi:UDP:flavonoid glycosyltransferase YjiC (YdhE family)